MFNPINLSAFADPVLDELVSGVPKNLDDTILLDLAKNANGTVLEIGCGYGRITIPLAERGIELVGVELCRPSIAAARRKGGDLPIQWVEGDARSIQLGRKFPFVFARGGVFDFMLTRPDQEAMLARVREHLTDDGIFAFDICYYRLSDMVDQEESEWFTLTDNQGRNICATGLQRFDYDRQLYFQRGWYRLDKADGEPIAEPWELTLRYTLPQDVETLLHYNGFQVIARYIDWDGTLPTAEEGASLFVCKLLNLE
jgi:SAM-dependent methyltransferase